MAAASFPLASVMGAVLSVNYDDVSLQVSSFNFNNAQGQATCVVTISYQGQTQAVQASPGLSALMIFSPAVSVVKGTFKGTPTITLPGVQVTMQALAA